MKNRDALHPHPPETSTRKAVPEIRYDDMDSSAPENEELTEGEYLPDEEYAPEDMPDETGEYEDYAEAEPEAPRTESRRERREREEAEAKAAAKAKSSRAAKRAKRRAEEEAPPEDLPPLPRRRKAAESEEEEEPVRPSRRKAVESYDDDDYEEDEAPRKKGGWKAPVIIIGVLIVLIAGALLAGAIAVQKVDTIYPGVEIAGVDLSGMTRDEARDALLLVGHERYDGFTVTANLPLGNTLAMSSADAGMRFGADKAADAAWNYGRTAGLFGAMKEYVQCRYLGKCGFTYTDDVFEVTLDEAKMRSIIADKAVDIDAQLLESSIVIGDDSITLVKGASGMTLDEEVVFTSFRDAFLTGENTGFTYESTPTADDEAFDFQALYDEIYSEVAEAEILYNPEIDTSDPAADDDDDTADTSAETTDTTGSTENASGTDVSTVDFNGEPYIVTQSSVGRTFDVEAAQSAWDAALYGDTVTIPMTVTNPEHTSEEINSLLFADKLSKNWTMVKLLNRDYCDEVRTSLSGSSDDRISNVKKACSLLDGLVLIPGQTLSFNDTLGERTEANGWKPATAYANGEVRQEYGGGICQVSSTLYNAVLYANLEIVERECHQFQVGYLPWGMDATVSWGWPDFKFRNNAEYPIKIHAWVDDETNECCVQILGTDVNHQYVLMRFNNWEVFDETDTYHDADGNPLSVGMAAATWRMVFNDGDDYNTATPVSEEYEAYSTYKYHTEDIEARNVPLSGGEG